MAVGDRVFIQNPQTKEWKNTGTIEEKGQNEREFMVRNDKGGLWRRNIKFLKLQDPAKRNQTAQQKPEPTGSAKKKIEFAAEDQIKTFTNTEEEREYRYSKEPNQAQGGQGGLRRGKRQRHKPERWGYDRS